ncbi:hypothetical protein HN873_056368 [Arachis hypogaea]
MSMQEGKQSLKPQDTSNRAAPESPQSANSRTECMEVIIAGQSNTKEDEGQLMQFAIGECLTTEKGRKWKRLARQGAAESDTKSEPKKRLMSGIAEVTTKKARTEDENAVEQMVEGASLQMAPKAP